MDAQHFDDLVAQAARRPSRRSAMRLLTAGLLGALLPATTRAAQRSDRDNDGLFDDDETNVYGTDPDIPDSDGDTRDDGQEVFDGTNPLVNENAPPPPPADPAPAPPPAQTCSGLGGVCAQFSDCCPGEYVQCCFNASGIGDCQDVSLTSFICTGYANVPATGCGVGLTNCGGFCTNLSTDNGNCGACGQSCAINASCKAGTCAQICSGGLTSCNGICVDLQTHTGHCGSCGNYCGLTGDGEAATCERGVCQYPF